MRGKESQHLVQQDVGGVLCDDCAKTYPSLYWFRRRRDSGAVLCLHCLERRGIKPDNNDELEAVASDKDESREASLLSTAFGIVYLLGTFMVLVGPLGLWARPEQPMGPFVHLGWPWLALGVIFLTLGYLVKRQSERALWAAMVLYGMERSWRMVGLPRSYGSVAVRRLTLRSSARSPR